MDIDPELARLSDLSFQTTFAIYVLAMLMFAGQYASSQVKKSQQRELIGAPVAGEGKPGIKLSPQQAKRSWFEKFGGMGYALVVIGAGFHLASIVLRGLSTDRFPLGNMYEFVSAMVLTAVVSGLIIVRKREHRPLWIFILVPVVLLVFLAGTVLYADAAPVVPALRSFWLPIHVTLAVLGSGLFLVAGVASVMFLFRVRRPEGEEGSGFLGGVADRLPSAQTLDRIAYRSTIIAFPVFGLGVILGAVWAEAAWGRFWGWDPKETMSFVTWVVYAAYLHARATAGWRDVKAAWINVVGFLAIVFNLFFINMVVSGLHSYAGLN
ncbi:c-type cytochrome biogenesis protein CcsB [Hoyosella rhizosphaerae]|uniref:C-type cytochrome biogenesis protein CcsB n=1 Tax=Hoyosella rhizosphaerae TaxID=1755582 RepID=A0A916XJF0_9ACTN|nr:c-type cytochrome biogenesis protein CcsB [Hoyosella rhizosphaerae]MBN4925286.1 c-type cytochrome biogenesis protein CcsB [Hoyosella rhizosphaerae]GGC76505.1 c-type cytochrome biogenesis protein CcsB [Hoyosella rhizosphaerae]